MNTVLKKEISNSQSSIGKIQRKSNGVHNKKKKQLYINKIYNIKFFSKYMYKLFFKTLLQYLNGFT